MSTKLDTFCYLTVKTARATCRRFDTIPACDRQTDRWTDGQTDGIAVASTALAMQALRHAVKKSAAHTDSPDGETGKTCLGGGMHCPSASSLELLPNFSCAAVG